MPRVPGHAAAKRLVLEVVGWLLVLAGMAAIVLPGPGLLMLFGGLAVLSQQYAWAERRMRPVEARAKQAAAESVRTWPRICLSTLGALFLIALGVVWFIQPDAPAWWPVDDKWWLAGGWATGLTLDVSGLIALALIVHSIRHYRS